MALYKTPKRNIVKMGYIEPYEGETIEQKVARITETNEPISDGAPIIFTEKKDGVRPEYDIRTDRWELAQSAMDKVNATKIAKSKQYAEDRTEQTKEGNEKTPKIETTA